MAINHVLPLHEEILLLALRDEGTIPMGSMYAYAIAGAIVAELALRERISVEKVKKSDQVRLLTPSPTGEPLLDEGLERIRTAKRRLSVAQWVAKFGQLRARDRVADRLVQRSILRRAERRVLFVFSRKLWPTVDPRPEAAVVDAMRRAILAGEQPDFRTAILIALAQPAGLLSNVFDKKQRKQHKQRIAEIAGSVEIAGVTGKAVRSTIEAVSAAVIAVMAASAAASST